MRGGGGWAAPGAFEGTVTLSDDGAEVAPRSVGVLARPLPGEEA